MSILSIMGVFGEVLDSEKLLKIIHASRWRQSRDVEETNFWLIVHFLDFTTTISQNMDEKLYIPTYKIRNQKKKNNIWIHIHYI